mgnify:CR=1 FL=1
MEKYVHLENVGMAFESKKGRFVALKEVNLTLRQGEFVSLIGHSGCGKSTVLSMLAGLNEISDGGIILAGKELVGAGPDRGARRSRHPSWAGIRSSPKRTS